MVERRPLPLLGVAILTGLIFVIFWRLHVQPSRTSSVSSSSEISTSSGNNRFFSGPYRLLKSDNITMEVSPFDSDFLTPDDHRQLIDLYDFTFTINEPAVFCNVSDDRPTPLVLAIVHSAPKHFSNRKAIRSTWGRDLDVVFLIGDTDNVTQHQLEEENARHKDIVQGSFVDSYRNLTYKHVMGLKWISYYCKSPRYILKLDDDVFVNTRNLNDLILRQFSSLGARKLILCRVVSFSYAKRTYRSKWRVTPAEYKGRWYPGYCPGWAVLYSPDVVFTLYKEAQRTPYFWIDDVHVTGTLVINTNLSHTSLGLKSYLWTDDKEEWDNHLSDFVVGLTEHYEFYELWRTLS